MSFLGLFGSNKPAPGTPVLSEQEVKQALLNLNRPTAPYQVREANSSDGNNISMVAEWKIVDATWYEIFAKSGLKKIFKVLIKIDPQKHEVVTTDQEFSISWEAGIPTIAASVKYFKGQKNSVAFGIGGGIVYSEELGPGRSYQYKFVSSEMKNPIKEAILSCGWTHKLG